MRRIACVVAAFVGVLVPLGAAPRLKGPPGPTLYCPTAVGTEWVYSYKAGTDTSRVKRTAVKAEPQGEGVLVSIDREWDGKTTADSRVLVSADGLLALPAPGKEGESPLWVLKRPIVRGKSWEMPRTGWGEPVFTYVTAGVEAAEVPAGTFQAVRVDQVESRGGIERSRVSSWYARDVGLVKWTNFAGSSEVLVSFAPGNGGSAAPGPAAR